MPNPNNPDTSRLGLWLFICFSAFLFIDARAENTVLYLRNGDRLSGVLVAETNNVVVLSNAWNSELKIPVPEIVERETLTATNQLAATPSPVLPEAFVSKTNAPATEKVPKHWSGEARIGMDWLRGAKDRDIYYGRFKLTYSRPYESDPNKFFKNIFDYSFDYARTDGELSANRMNGGSKTDFDLGEKLYIYNLVSGGYDKTRKIDFMYEFGPGLGYHLNAATNFTVNLENGLDYQVQDRSDSPDTRNIFLRLAEEITWRINTRFRFTERFEYFPQLDPPGEHRARFDSTLSYILVQNISLNLSVIDIYDTRPADDVARNEVQVRSSLGLKF
jgi:putative salt-induced outer membrane protein YdiY